MNVDASKAVQNSSSSSASVDSTRGYLPNGGCSEGSCNHSSNDLSFPPGGLTSLRLPVVVVLKPIKYSYSR